MTIEKKQIYSRGGYSVWKNEFYNCANTECENAVASIHFLYVIIFAMRFYISPQDFSYYNFANPIILSNQKAQLMEQL